MRTALASIKEELGPEAVIMSNKRINGGVELMAAIDSPQVAPERTTSPELTSVHQKAIVEDSDLSEHVQSTMNGVDDTGVEVADSLQALLARQQKAAKQPSAPTKSVSEEFKLFTEKLAKNNPQPQHEEPTVTNFHDDDDFFTPEPSKSGHNLDQPPVPLADSSASKAELNEVKQQLDSIKQLLEHQVSGLLWQDIARKEPVRALLIKKLLALGISAPLADQLACFIPDDFEESSAWENVLDILTKQISTTNNDILHRGGVVSLVGPTGVGKTTTIAKLAARCAQIHGADNVALISTDTFRVAGFEQLQTYGKIIGCPVKLAHNSDDFDKLIQQFQHKKLVLIDTAGMGQRDMRLTKQLSYLVNKANVKIKNYLVLSANTQKAVMNESVAQFKKIPLSGCIFTKLDECLSLGEIISTSIQNALPIGYLTDGQRVPEDIKVANAEKLVKAAEKLAENSSEDYDWMPLVANNSAMI